MKATARSLLALACWPATRAAQELSPGLRVLMYHRVARLGRFDQLTVSPARFEAQMRLLARRRRVVSLLDGLRALRGEPPSEPMVAVTFDDGYLDNLVEAAPILQRYRIPATIFVTTHFCDQVAVHPRYVEHAGARIHLNWDEVAQLSGLPGIEIGSHTHTHPYLQRVSDAQALKEIAGSREVIAARLGCPVRALCYPSGDVGTREARLARDAGYDVAVTVAPGVNHADLDPMLVRRTEVTDRDDERSFALKLDGAFDPLHRVLHLRRRRHFERERDIASGRRTDHQTP